MPSEPKVNILMVDDHPENLLALEAILEGLGQNLIKAHSGMEALRCLLNQDFAVILLDVQMPDMDGFETAALIRQRARSHSTPIIFLTAFSTSDTLQIRGYSLGAVDYLFKPIQPEILTSKVSVFVELYQKTAQIERQAAELKKSEERFRRLSASSPVGIFLWDTSACCTYMNSRCQVICGYTLEQITQKWWQIIHPEERNSAFTEWLACFHSGQEYSNEFRIQTQNEVVRWVHLRSSPMLSDKGEVIGYVGTLEDISDRKQAEAERSKLIYEQAARAEAESANRMKDEFLAVLSHELRTPLNSILGWAGLLRTRKFDEKTIAKALETIERNAKSQAQLIEDILDISRIIQGKLRLHLCPVNLIPIIEAALNAVRPAAEAKAIQLETCFDTAKFVCADPERLQQVIWNLLTNAIKFTPERGIVEVRLDVDSAYAQIHVRDTGIGISPEFLPYVFDTFRQGDSTTTRSHGGLGLGLGIVRHLVELHHGTVAVSSAGEGQGATFTVRLPVIEKVEGEPLKSLPSLP
ncbi:sensor histidine kinase [Gloeocapsopsis dulcis]|uniref:Circadian input-output histidine kinase CikA n=1 Tax=Gloeocapsopsis dulcis AAB1 = 1H9 TaxID=1433147 RepID=A0A6N8G240_9CHRO|nr:ATP-binding protein [Gloeocapsopsis dulcis]MUL38236.1 hybrid sensor histidine kinase/response regulator [Gloeocapsopsis dulcis AAB1 = 1H9]WNN90282.1 ATP-binding protein [Gloeocapsopsis dulcis]